MKLWDISGDGRFWKVQLDVRDLGNTLISPIGLGQVLCLAESRKLLLVWLTVGALPLSFQVKLGLVRGKYIPAGLRAAEASCVSALLFRAAIVWAVWSSKMPLAHTPAALNLLDGPVGVDPALHIVWVRFRIVRRYLAYCLDEVPGIFKMLDVISGRVLVMVLLISAAELGFAGDGDERGWVRPSLPPLWMLTGPIQHFFSSILDAWRCRVFAKLAEREGFQGVQFADFQGSLQLLISSHLRERDKILLRAILCGGVWNGFLLGKAKKEDVPCQFCGKKDGDGHLFWECSFSTFIAC